ncbi:MAG: hypothetical protein ACOX0Y_03020 [Thiopseudomonas sp.]
MAQYVAIFSGEHRKYWTQDQFGYTDHPKDFGWWSVREARKIVESLGPDKQIELHPYKPSRLQLMLRGLLQ